MNRREKILLGVLVGLAMVAFVFQPQDDAGDLAVKPSDGQRRTNNKTNDTLESTRPSTSNITQGTSPVNTSGQDNTTRRFPDAAAEVNLFPGQSVTPPLAEAPAGPPEPPAFPFDYLGIWREQEIEIVFFSAGNQLLRVRQGDVLQNTWRLDQVSRQQLVFTYLPLKMTKTMRIPQ